MLLEEGGRETTSMHSLVINGVKEVLFMLRAGQETFSRCPKLRLEIVWRFKSEMLQVQRKDDLGASFSNVSFVSYPTPDLVLAYTAAFVL